MAVFDWCLRGKHDECKRSYEVFYTEVRKNKTVMVKTGEVRRCQCKNKKCECSKENNG